MPPSLRSKLFALVLLPIFTYGCSTRELTETISGSTAQRLATYSLERFVEQIAQQPDFYAVTGKTVRLRSHFVAQHSLLNYADQLLRIELQSNFKVQWANTTEKAAFDIDVFYNSIGTDYDTFGLSVPSFGLTATPDARISVLSIDMFHGVTEGYALITDNVKKSVSRTGKLLSRVRTDNVSTPIIEFPINQLD